jgi:hypothetical protein
MDYYAIINGQKKGPFDTISIIKQIHSGAITPETQISNAIEGNYQAASGFPMLSEIFHNQTFVSGVEHPHAKTKLSLAKSLKDGIDLWSRYALSFIIISSAILALTFALSKALNKIPAVADYPAAGTYIVSLVTAFLYLNFFGYILFAKRSQALDIGKYISQTKSGFLATFIFAIILALFPTASAFNPIIGIAAMIAFLVYATLGAFVPFVIFDKKVGMAAAYAQSSKKIRSGGSEAIGVVLAIIAVNIVVAILPAIFFPELFIFGLFISIPITVSSLAYIYDEIGS